MNRRASLLFAAVSVVWGIPYLLIKIGVDGGIGPVTLAWARMVIGGAVLLVLARRAGVLGQLRGRWRPLLGYAVAELAIPFPMIAVGERHLASSMTAIIIASVPLLVAVIALRVDATQRVTGRRLAGLLIGFLGVALLVGVDASGRLSTLLAVGAVLLGAVGYATGPLILNRHLGGIDARASMGASLWLAALLLTPLALLDWPARMPTAGAFGALAGLALVCSAAAFVLMAQLIAEIGPSRAVVITYINPIVALALGVGFLNERPGLAAFGGLALILSGSWIATRGPAAAPAPVPASDLVS